MSVTATGRWVPSLPAALVAPVTRTLTLPLYYTGLTVSARIREQEGEAREVRLNNKAEAKVTLSLPARGLNWLVIE